MAIPYWVGHYIGLEFKEHGRDRKGLDCWGLVRLVLAEQFGIPLPSYSSEYKDTRDSKAIDELYQDEKEIGDWLKIGLGQERLGDVVCMRIRGVPMHVGLIIEKGRMLHIEKGSNSCFVKYNNLEWKNKIDGVYRRRELIDVGGLT